MKKGERNMIKTLKFIYVMLVYIVLAFGVNGKPFFYHFQIKYSPYTLG